MFHCKTSLATFLKKLPQNLICPFLLYSPFLITLVISFSFHQAIIFLYYSCLCFNKSVFNWTFCQLHCSRENPNVRNFFNRTRIRIPAVVSETPSMSEIALKLFFFIPTKTQNRLECLSLPSSYSDELYVARLFWQCCIIVLTYLVAKQEGMGALQILFVHCDVKTMRD